MVVNKELERVMEDKEFNKKLMEAESEEGIKEIFAAEGIDYEEIFSEKTEDELDEGSLDDVSGGVPYAVLYAIIKYGSKAWKAGKYAGIIIRAAYDAKVYKNPYRSYSKKSVDAAIAYIER